MISAELAGRYLAQYARSFRNEYRRFVEPPPFGGGFPRINISPYVGARELRCHVTVDGAVIAVESTSASQPWLQSGKCGFVVVASPRGMRRMEPLLYANHEGRFGLYAEPKPVFAFDQIPDEILEGRLPEPKERWTEHVGDTWIKTLTYDQSFTELLQRLTLGVLGGLLNVFIPTPASDLWRPRLLGNVGLASDEGRHHRFFDYLELVCHVDEDAWDRRGIWMRAYVDVRRSFARAFTLHGLDAAWIDYDSAGRTDDRFYDRLSEFERKLDEFERLLNERSDASESVLHNYLRDHPAILDLYGKAASSKPRWRYPEGASPFGKQYVEPDFVIARSDGQYILVELERSSANIGTRSGRPSSDATQPAFQISEWLHYIGRHHDLLEVDFPGINDEQNRVTRVIMSRATQQLLEGDSQLRSQFEIQRNTFRVDEWLSYDDLINQGRQALALIASLLPRAPSDSN